MIPDFERRAIVNEVVARVAALLDERMPSPARPILTVHEAARFAGKRTAKAFRVWCGKWRVRPCAQGRYSRRQIEVAMEREARGTYVHSKALA